MKTKMVEEMEQELRSVVADQVGSYNNWGDGWYDHCSRIIEACVSAGLELAAQHLEQEVTDHVSGTDGGHHVPGSSWCESFGCSDLLRLADGIRGKKS